VSISALLCAHWGHRPGAGAYHHYWMCDLLTVAAATVDLTGAVNISRTGTDSQLVLWYNQYHLPVPLENVEEGAYITVELNKVSRSQFLAKRCRK
jgi:hypothetical protein